MENCRQTVISGAHPELPALLTMPSSGALPIHPPATGCSEANSGIASELPLASGLPISAALPDVVEKPAVRMPRTPVSVTFGALKITLAPKLSPLQILRTQSQQQPGSVPLAAHAVSLVAGLLSPDREDFQASLELVAAGVAAGQSVPTEVVRGIADAYDQTQDGGRKFQLMLAAAPLMAASPYVLFVLDNRHIGQEMKLAISSQGPEGGAISTDEWQNLLDFESEQSDLAGIQDLAFALFHSVATSPKCTPEILTLAERCVALVLQQDADLTDIDRAMKDLRTVLTAAGIE